MKNGTSARREAARYPHLQGGPGVIELHLITNTPVRHTEVTTVRCPVRRQDAAVCVHPTDNKGVGGSRNRCRFRAWARAHLEIDF